MVPRSMVDAPRAEAPQRLPSIGWCLVWAGAWIAGIAVQLQQAGLQAAAVAVSLTAAATLVGLAMVPGMRRRLPRLVPAMVALGIACLGFGLTELRAQHRLDDQLPEGLEGVDLELVVSVDDLPQRVESGWRYTVEVHEARHDGRTVMVPARIALSWFDTRESGDAQVEAGGAAAPVAPQWRVPPMRAGERWALTARLRQPHGTMNPHAFDVELWWFERGLRALGHVRAEASVPPRRLAPASGAWVTRWRETWRDALMSRVSDLRAAGVLAALAIGDQAAIDGDDWDLFRLTGVAHLMSISGTHVTMFAWMAGGVVGWAWRRHRRAPLWCPAPSVARWGGWLAACGYAVLAGWGVPAQRTVWMLGTVALVQTMGAAWPWPLVLLAAAVVVTAVDPWALLQAGFWLSFGAVGLLMASDPAARHGGAAAAPRGWRGALLGMLKAQAVISVGLAPFTLLLFQQVSVAGLLANLLAIPWVTLVVTPLSLLGIVAPVFWILGAWALAPLFVVLEALAGSDWGVWWAAVAPTWAQVLGLIGAVCAVLPWPWRFRFLALPLMLPLLWPVTWRPPPGRFELLAADVGQGTAVLVRTRHHALLYDAGPRYGAEFDAGRRVLIPLLRALGVDRLDTLVLSHRDTDHVGGAASLLEAVPVSRLLASIEPGHDLTTPREGMQVQPCHAGLRWHWDGVDFEVLHPQADDRTLRWDRPNTMSCVLRVADGHKAALLAGDVERLQELSLVERQGAALQADWLLVPHHGSRTSSTARFLSAVQPRLALAQAGYRNRFGHPAHDVQARYLAAGITLHTSAACGAQRWPAEDSEANDAAATAQCERDRRARYWHHRPR